jgi:hypothetical protein
VIEFLAVTEWQVHHGAVSAPGMSGIVGQLTMCRDRGVVFFVRENIAYNAFLTSSAVRWRMKTAGTLPRDAVQVLELCAPSDRWDELARAVAALDRRGRQVRRNRRFTGAWADSQFPADVIEDARRAA